MDSVTLIFRTDSWHTNSSKELIGVATLDEHKMTILHTAARVDKVKFSKDDYYNLESISQTQGYAGEGEFVIEEVETDKFL